MNEWRYYALREKPWQDLRDLSTFFRIAFHAQFLGVSVTGMSYWRIPRQYNGQWERALTGRFSPFEGVDFLEEIQGVPKP